MREPGHEMMETVLRRVYSELRAPRLKHGFDYAIVLVKPRTSDPDGPNAVIIGSSYTNSLRVTQVLKDAALWILRERKKPFLRSDAPALEQTIYEALAPARTELCFEYVVILETAGETRVDASYQAVRYVKIALFHAAKGAIVDPGRYHIGPL